MRRHAPAHVQVKAAGGIRDYPTLLQVREIGVSRIGSSRTNELLDECRRQLGLPPINFLAGSTASY
jgi:deoxyribose-phosphate aldolase